MKKEIVVYGVVSTDEWDWREWHHQIRKQNRKNPMVYISVDFGKLIGLLEKLEELTP